MSNEPNDRLGEIGAAAEQLMAAADGGRGLVGDSAMDREDLEAEVENALQECYDLAARIRDLAGGGS